MDKNESSNRVLIGIMASIFAVVMTMILCKPGMNIESSKKAGKISEYTSIEQFRQKQNLEFDLPLRVAELFNSDIQATVMMGNFIEVYSAEKAILKISNFVDIHADPLGLYEKCESEHEYLVKGSSINYFKYRTGYKEFENCTIVNWCNAEKSYGLIVDGILTEDDIIALLEFDPDNISAYTADNQNGQEDQDGEHKVLNINKNLTMTIPSVNSVVNVVDRDELGYAEIYLDDVLSFVVIYDTDSDISMTGNEIKNETNGVVIKYSDGEQFEIGSEAQSSFGIIVNKIGEVSNSVSLLWG